MLKKLLDFILVIRKKLFEIPTTSIELFSIIVGLAFCFVYFYRQYISHQTIYYEYSTFYSPWLIFLIVFICLMHMRVVTKQDTKSKIMRAASCRLLALFWLITAVTFTIDGLNTSFFTHTILGMFLIFASYEIDEGANDVRIQEIKDKLKEDRFYDSGEY